MTERELVSFIEAHQLSTFHLAKKLGISSANFSNKKTGKMWQKFSTSQVEILKKEIGLMCKEWERLEK